MLYEYTDADIEQMRTWTLIDEDLQGLSDEVRAGFREARISFGAGDFPRTLHWSGLEEIEEFLDIPYLDDGTREHLLDLYLPHDEILRNGKTLPVYVDIHGGGFTYGMKELNKNFNLRLAQQGFAVFSVNYRMAPSGSFLDQLEDVAAALRWIKRNLAQYPVDPDAIFLTGDSAGGTLAFYSTAIQNNPALADALGIETAGITVRAMALISPLIDLTEIIDPKAESVVPYLDPVSTSFFGLEFRVLDSKHRDYRDMVAELEFPPTYLCTSSDDFLEADSLRLAAELVCADKSVQIDDFAPKKGETLGHVFPVCMTWLPESRQVLETIRDFTYRYL